MRTTRADLDQLAAIITNVTGEPHEVTYAYGRPRLFRKGGSVEVSPRLPTGDLALWMRAFIAGAYAVLDR